MILGRTDRSALSAEFSYSTIKQVPTFSLTGYHSQTRPIRFHIHCILSEVTPQGEMYLTPKPDMPYVAGAVLTINSHSPPVPKLTDKTTDCICDPRTIKEWESVPLCNAVLPTHPWQVLLVMGPRRSRHSGKFMQGTRRTLKWC